MVSVYSRPIELTKALGRCEQEVYLVLGFTRIPTAVLAEIDETARGRGHRDLAQDRERTSSILDDIEFFFAQCALRDPFWQFAFSSKVLLSIPGYRDIQLLFTLNRYILDNPGQAVHILVTNVPLRKLVESLFGGHRFWPPVVMPNLRAWGRMLRTLLRTVLSRAPQHRADLLVCTLTQGNADPNRADTYFGNLTSLARSARSVETVYLASGPQVWLSKATGFNPLEAYATIGDVLVSWFRSLGRMFRLKPPKALLVAGKDLSPILHYLEYREIRTGEHFMQAFMNKAYGRVIAAVQPRVLLFPFENRSWEKRLVTLARRAGLGKIIGYQHTSITPRHLALRVEPAEMPDEAIPDAILTTGEITLAWLEKLSPLWRRRAIAGVSMRRARDTVPEPTGSECVLVAISSNREEAWSLLRATFEAARENDIRFIVRSHPTIPVQDLFALFAWPPRVILSAGRSLIQDLTEATAVAYSSSTVVLEGMLYGRLPIFVDIGDVPAGDPITGRCPFKVVAATPVEFGRALRKVSAMSPKRRAEMSAAARDYAERYLMYPTKKRIDRILALLN